MDMNNQIGIFNSLLSGIVPLIFTFTFHCERDLEGIVAKWTRGTYRIDGRATSWLKCKNPEYSRGIGRHELFHRRSVGGGLRRRAAIPRLALR